MRLARLGMACKLLLVLLTAQVHAAAPEQDLDEIKARMNAAQGGDPEQRPGAPLYREHCAACHEGQVQKAPTHTFLSMLSADSIHAALTEGIMQGQAAGLDDLQKKQVAEYLSGEAMGTV
ncbi:MAG: c-type cytochrome, partial [Steroidobacteraceae bacterium]